MKIVEETQSICPQCLEEKRRPLKSLPAELFEKDGAIFINRKCPEHPDLNLKELVSSHAVIFNRMQRLDKKFSPEHAKISNPRTKTEYGCPNDCGICPDHQSSSVLTIIDVTNRCNMRCNFCFANAGAAGYVYELTKEQVFSMIDNLRSNLPYPPPALQFSGGEPTLYKELTEVIRYARRKGFNHIEINTNGLVVAGSGGDEYWKELIDAGVSSAYLQFDGVNNEVHKKTRGMDKLFDKKEAAMNNMRKAGEDNIVLTVTLVKGINDNQVGKIIEYAIKNQDLVKGVNFQPVSCTGRIDYSRRKEMRITVSDVVKLAEEQTKGFLVADDFYPISAVNPVIRVTRDLTHHRPPDFSPSVFCGTLTMLVKDESGKFIPLPRIMDVENFMTELVKVDSRIQKYGVLYKPFVIPKLYRTAKKYVDDLPRKYLFDLIKQQRKGSYSILSEFMKLGLFIGCMHFMDPWNYDLGRVRNCVVHYAAPDGRIIPFCTYNNLGYREEIERKFSVPIEKANN
jgi:hypothetical protein